MQTPFVHEVAPDLIVTPPLWVVNIHTGYEIIGKFVQINEEWQIFADEMDEKTRCYAQETIIREFKEKIVERNHFSVFTQELHNPGTSIQFVMDQECLVQDSDGNFLGAVRHQDGHKECRPEPEDWELREDTIIADSVEEHQERLRAAIEFVLTQYKATDWAKKYLD